MHTSIFEWMSWKKMIKINRQNDDLSVYCLTKSVYEWMLDGGLLKQQKKNKTKHLTFNLYMIFISSWNLYAKW